MKVQFKAGEYHVWTNNWNWVAWFKTEAEAETFVKADYLNQ